MVTPYDYSRPRQNLPPLPRPSRQRMPGSVLAAVILVFLGAGLSLALVAVLSLLGPGLEPIPTILGGFAAVFLLLGLALCQRRNWARVLVLILSVVSIVLGVIELANGVAGQLHIGWPILFLVLLNTGSARNWFRGD